VSLEGVRSMVMSVLGSAMAEGASVPMLSIYSMALSDLMFDLAAGW